MKKSIYRNLIYNLFVLSNYYIIIELQRNGNKCQNIDSNLCILCSSLHSKLTEYL